MKTTTKLTTTACALAMTFGSVICAADIYAASPSITINNDTESLYIDSGTKSSSDGTATYDASANTLTLNNFHGDDILVKDLESLKIILNGKNTLTMTTQDGIGNRSLSAKKTDLEITGTGSLSIKQESLSSDGTFSQAIQAATLKIKSTTLDVDIPEADTCLYANKGTSILGAVTGEQNSFITIESSNVTLLCDSAATAQGMVINNSNVIVDGGFSNADRMKYLEINDGELSVNGDNIVIAGGIKINKGTVNIHGKKSSIECGIELESIFTGGTPNQLIMAGGNLNIDGVSCGIGMSSDSATPSFIKFSGGTTRIIAEDEAVKVMGNNRSKDDIIIENNMYLLPSDRSVLKANYVAIYYIGSNGEEVIITDNEDLVKETTEEEAKEETVENKESSAEEKTETVEAKPTTVKAPDTGIFSEGDNELVAIAISVGAVALLSAILYLSVYTRNRVAGRVKFNK